MKIYNPNQIPDPIEWQALDESEQIRLVKQYHKRKRIKLPNATMHSVLHVVVENQIAMGGELNVFKTLDRLLADGLDRHDAVHAIGAILAGHLYRMWGKQSSQFNAETYTSDLEALTVEKWRAMGQPED